MWTPDASDIITAEQKAAAEHKAKLTPLAPYQFRAMLKIAGVEQQVMEAIANLPDETTKALAEAKMDYALAYHRDEPLFAMLAPVVGLTDEQIDALWLQAVSL